MAPVPAARRPSAAMAPHTPIATPSPVIFASFGRRSTATAARPADGSDVGFTFAIISDTHNQIYCALGQGKWIDQAIAKINARRPAFVLGLGDLIAGGGDCRSTRYKKRFPGVVEQLAEFKSRVLDPLRVPFVPVPGNHDLTRNYSRRADYPHRAWNTFWNNNRAAVLPAARTERWSQSRRFTYRGFGFALISYYQTFGLHPDELKWVRAHVKKNDLVFRHINPYGVSCDRERSCGFAMRNTGVHHYEKLTETFTKRGVTALFSGHTHAFYDGRCDGLRFVNTGSLGARAMEHVKGWRHSPHRLRQSFVWVNVKRNGELDVDFEVWNQRCQCFRPFDKSEFPPVVISRREKRKTYEEGVAATCITTGHEAWAAHLPAGKQPKIQ